MTRKEEREQFANEQVKGAEKLYGYKYSIKDVKYAFKAGAEWADKTSQEKLTKLKLLADAMYEAAQMMSTNASGLHKAMQDYRQFVINELKEK